MKHLASTIARLERNRTRILDELHPLLRARVGPLLVDLGGRLVPICGYRGAEEQAKAKASGASAADFGESPHNFTPALAVDVVLHPAFVQVRPHPQDASFPDLWDDETPEALAAWEALDQAAKVHDLERVRVRGRLDRPHLQLPGWRSYIPL